MVGDGGKQGGGEKGYADISAEMGEGRRWERSRMGRGKKNKDEIEGEEGREGRKYNVGGEGRKGLEAE